MSNPSDNPISQQVASPKDSLQVEPEVVTVNLEDEEVKGDKKEEKNCEKKGSQAWDYFDRIPGCPVGKEKAKCKFCKVMIGCNTRNGTSAMMNHLKLVCAKSPLRTNLDKLQKTLRFEKLKKDDKFHTVEVHEFNQERLRKKLALMCIKDNQPFRIVEHEGFRELMNEAEPRFKMPSRWTIARDILMRDMAKRMKEKYDKYWDNVENTNFLLYVAVVLDPRYKMSYVEFCFAKIYGKGSTQSFIMCDKVLKTLQELFDYYMNLKGREDSSSQSKTNQPNVTWDDDFEKYMEDRDEGAMGKSELDAYLVEARERKGEGFDILGWWKNNSTRLPILSEIAKHVLGMPVSSVASEAAFSTSGRMIDAYRSSLSPKTAEALICSQDWLRNSNNVTDLRGEPEEYLQHEQLENDELKMVSSYGNLGIDE